MPLRRRKSHHQQLTKFEQGRLIGLREGEFSFLDRFWRKKQLRHGQLGARLPVAYIPLTPSHCRLRRLWCQTRAHWRTEWRSVVFSDESRFCFGASVGHVLVRRREGEHLQPNYLRSTHTLHLQPESGKQFPIYDSRITVVVIPNSLTGNLHVSLVIKPTVLPFINSIQGGFSNRITLAFTPLLQRNVLFKVLTCYLDLSLIEHIWDIIG
ncbi:RNase H domain-containing protein [Trichonephila clavipes]|nr:RNase H domain-containing protein [Trichonephila clavipes]